MKLHLPLQFRRLLLSCISVVACVPATAGTLSSEVDLQLYADFGQNRGRYSVTNVNALLEELNKNGVTISYTSGKESYTLNQEMISFESRQEGNGAAAAVCYNFIATVSHNGVQNPYFSYLELGADNAIHYKGIEYRYPNVFDNGEDGAFIHSAPGTDFKVTRLSKLVTDVTTSKLYSSEKVEQGLIGELMYRSGAGYSDIYDPETGAGTSIERCITGAIQQIDGSGISENGSFWIGHTADGWDVSVDPLPFGVNSGDSGSPVWVWDTEAGEYRYLAAVAIENANNANGTSKANLKYAEDVISQYDQTISTASTLINLGATRDTDETVTQVNSASTISTTLWKGDATDDSGKVLATYTGVKQGLSAWNDMAAIRDLDNWYALTDSYLNASENNTAADMLDYADLFMTDNLVFQATDCSEYTVRVNEKLDLGIGYVEFTKGNREAASYTVSGAGYLDSAGYIVGADVALHLSLTSSDKTREVRKIGEGNLHIEGNGNNEVLLNLGGKGKTYLEQTGGYAAYNVLANNGATVVLGGENGISQIKRDFTFGNGGGTLDLNGFSWNEDHDFTISALTQDATLANYGAGSTAVATFTQGGTFLGSFADDENAALQVNFSGTGTWTLHSIHTNLKHADSGLHVQGGKVTLVGTRTQHATSRMDNSVHPWQNENDWHYADSSMNVTVEEGAKFELGSHARLTGDVTVNGGTYVMREGVQNRYEYVEGGYELEDTDKISSFFGHKGNTVLNGGTLQVEFSEGTTSHLTYAGNITGMGNMTVDTADGILSLTGTNTFSGAKQLLKGRLVADDVAALGSSANGWQIAAGASLTVQSGLTSENALDYIDKTKSEGLLVLGSDMEHALNLDDSSLIIGAESGKVVQYGAAQDAISATNLGGGGGTLQVNAKLTGAQGLVLGQSGETGVVLLNNEANDFNGTISFAGNVALDYSSTAALGASRIVLADGGGVMLRGALQQLKSHLANGYSGALLLDYYQGTTLDMTGEPTLSLSAAGSASYSGSIIVGSGESYRLGGFIGSLSIGKEAVSGTNAMVVDAKGTSGGQIMMAVQNGFTGAVTVQDSSSEATGDVTLAFSENNALLSSASITVNKGGVLDVGHTTQTLTNLQVNEGGVLTSAAGGELIFHMTSEKFQTGSMRLDQVKKTGSANLVLDSDDNEWNKLTISSGTVFTRKDNSLAADGVTRVENGAVLNMNTWNGAGFTTRSMHGHIELDGGATLSAGSYAEGHVTLTGSVKVDAGETATMYNGHWHLSGASYNKGGGTLKIDAYSLNLDSNKEQRIGGTVDVGITSLKVNSTASDASDMLKHFEHINISRKDALNTRTLFLEDTTWNTIWKIDQLTGDGDLVWNSDTTHSRTARVLLGGDGGFSGNITMNRNFDAAARRYQAYMEIASDNAVSSATINLLGSLANSNASLAINTANAKIGGLNGNANSLLLSGAAPVGSAGTEAPASTALNSLTVTGNGNYTYSGLVAGDATKGLNLVMTGDGTQSFNGNSVVLHDVSIQSKGSLELADVQSSLRILGDISMDDAGTLNMGNHVYELNTGNVLSVTSSGASLTAGISLNGGTLLFDAACLAEDRTMLAYTGSLSSNAGATVDFENVDSSMIDQGFTLVSGDWSGVYDKLTGANLGAYKVAFSVNDDKSLVVTFSENAHIWSGSDAANAWSDTAFGTTIAANSSTNLLFNDSAQTTFVNVVSAVVGAEMYFDNQAKDYSLGGSGSISVNSISQNGEGSTTISASTSANHVEVTAGSLDLQNLNFGGGRIKVQNGKLAMNLSAAATATVLHFGHDAQLELSGGKRLTISYGGEKSLTGDASIVLDGSSTVLQDRTSTYAVSKGTLNVRGAGDSSGNVQAGGELFVRKLHLSDSGKIVVNNAWLGSGVGIAFGSGDSSLELTNGAVLVLDDSMGSETGDILKAPSKVDYDENGAAVTVSEGEVCISVDNNSMLFAGGSEKSDNLRIELGNGATLGTSSELADFASDIKLVGGDATLTSDLYYLSQRNGNDRFSASKGVLKVSGNILSEKENSNLVIAGDSDYYGNSVGVQLAGSAHVTGTVKIQSGAVLRMVDTMSTTDVFSYTQNSGATMVARKNGDDATISGGCRLGFADGAAYVHGPSQGEGIINNALISLYDGASLSLQNVMLGCDSEIATQADSAKAAVMVNNVGLQVVEGESGSTSSEITTLDSATVLTLCGQDSTYTLESGSTLLEIGTSLLSGNLTLTGQSLMVSFDGYNFDACDAVRLTFVDGVTVNTGMHITAEVVTVQEQLEQGCVVAQMTGAYVTSGNVGSIVFIKNHSVPEPSTSALCLVTLAGLAARRRRRN